MNTHRTRPNAGPRASATCPHCGGKLKIRSSRTETPTYRQLNLACQDVSCGATFGADLEITHQISPSAKPNPAVTLRQSAPRRRAVNDDYPPRRDTSGPEVPPPANENETAAEAIGN